MNAEKTGRLRCVAIRQLHHVTDMCIDQLIERRHIMRVIESTASMLGDHCVEMRSRDARAFDRVASAYAEHY